MEALQTGLTGSRATLIMRITDSISRFTGYYKRHGFEATIRRASLAAKRKLFSNRMVVFYCDLVNQTGGPVNIPSSLRVERLRSSAELSAHDLQEITSFWNPKLARRNIQERFEKGASLWMIKSGDAVAGYSWTLRGATIAPYYFPLGPDDVQVFDFYAFPKYRGRAVLWFLIVHILHSLAAEGGSRAFGDVAEWNHASMSFYKMLPFRRLGLVRSFSVLGRKYVSWIESEAVEQTQETRTGATSLWQ
jgi:ribosomal protein S18 acetylase RimI-like enzyme